jgi:hypothetical protein
MHVTTSTSLCGSVSVTRILVSASIS